MNYPTIEGCEEAIVVMDGFQMGESRLWVSLGKKSVPGNSESRFGRSGDRESRQGDRGARQGDRDGRQGDRDGRQGDRTRHEVSPFKNFNDRTGNQVIVDMLRLHLITLFYSRHEFK